MSFNVSKFNQNLNISSNLDQNLCSVHAYEVNKEICSSRDEQTDGSW